MDIAALGPVESAVAGVAFAAALVALLLGVLAGLRSGGPLVRRREDSRPPPRSEAELLSADQPYGDELQRAAGDA